MYMHFYSTSSAIPVIEFYAAVWHYEAIKDPEEIAMKSPVYRLYVERKQGFDNDARRILSELTNFVGIKGLEGVRCLNRYDIEGIDQGLLESASRRIFSEPQSDRVTAEEISFGDDETVLVIEYLPGQYDQRADSASQCLALLDSGSGDGRGGTRPVVRCARLFALKGRLSANDLERCRSFLINPVDSREASVGKPASLAMETGNPEPIPVIEGFNELGSAGLEALRKKAGLAMDGADIAFLQSYFRKEGRNPTETEIRVLDTYWSDHCRHTTFNTVLEGIDIPDGPEGEPFREALAAYSGIRAELYGARAEGGISAQKPVTLMDMAVIGAKALKKRGLLGDVEESAEINACSVFIDVVITDDRGRVTGTEPWLLMFKNETHNHPTEIEPFGGAATCIGGAIRDPLSGRAWVYQALRVTGAGDPTAPIEATIPGKLPQIKLTREAAAGFSAYGNQIGLTTGQVVEYYDPGFLAKRMELGAVIAAAPADAVIREEPEAGDLVIMVGGGTGRDGIGGATGSSKAHTAESVSTAGAEVQKGNAVEERKIQRLFRDRELTRLIRRCNDFGAGGVAVAVGELAPGLDIDLDAVPKKYEGLNGTELAISESQERMAVVVRARDADAFIAAANAENLNACVIARVTDDKRLVMRWRGKTIVDIDREFLDTAGASRSARARIAPPAARWAWAPGKGRNAQTGREESRKDTDANGALSPEERWYACLADLSVASQRGLGERFDGSIGSSSVIFPMGGAWQSTPAAGMAARIAVGPGRETTTVSLMTMGYDPRACTWSPFHGAQYSVLESLIKILALGGDPRTARLSFQEYFERTASPEAWGKPAAALLGALRAQLGSGAAAIGGKDSMSGSFGDIHVPPTLVSFAVAVTDQDRVRDGTLIAPGHRLVLAYLPWGADNEPDWDAYHAYVEAVLALSSATAVHAAYPVLAGGIAAAICKMAFGNRIGARLDPAALERIAVSEVFARDIQVTSGKPGLEASADGAAAGIAGDARLFAPLYGSLILEMDETDLAAFAEKYPAARHWIDIGDTATAPEIAIGEVHIPLDRAQQSWEAPLARAFPPVSGVLPETALPEWSTALKRERRPVAHKATLPAGKAKPLVVLPVFPGTNCEYDMARAFRIAGAETLILPLRNRTAADLENSLEEFRKAIDRAEILALSGGFSAGDEPDGSGKFIANILRESRIADGVLELAHDRKGLVLGVCNGFQALVKVGLIPFGKILEPAEDMPTLTFNTVGRHISRFSRTRVSSAISPWAAAPGLEPGAIHMIPISHGEGRVILGQELARGLFERGQVFTQYVDAGGRPAMTEPDNPNGSMYAIEGMTDETGRILGKMGHSERPIDTGAGGSSRVLFKNIPGDRCENIFAAGVGYFG